jgi:glutathione S-transferase
MTGETVMLALYHDWDSVHSFKVRMCLAEKQADYDSRRVELLRFEHLRPEYLALNPNGVVPTLIHDGHVLFESSVINEYLDEVLPDPPLAPRDPYRRAKMRILIRLQDDVLYHAQRPATFQLMVKRMLAGLGKEELEALVANHPEPERGRHFLTWATGPVDEAVVAEARRKIAAVLGRLETALGDAPWLAGDAFSLADVAYAPFVDRLERLCFDELWAGRPAVAVWAARLKARPSFAVAVGPPEFRMAAPQDDRAPA